MPTSSTAASRQWIAKVSKPALAVAAGGAVVLLLQQQQQQQQQQNKQKESSSPEQKENDHARKEKLAKRPTSSLGPWMDQMATFSPSYLAPSMIAAASTASTASTPQVPNSVPMVHHHRTSCEAATPTPPPPPFPENLPKSPKVLPLTTRVGQWVTGRTYNTSHDDTSSSSSSQQAPKNKVIANPNDQYPNLSRHGKDSLLRKYLTPRVYHKLKDKVTSSHGVTLEDIIQAGVALPYGANPPYGVAGVYAGDAESYKVFHDLLRPMIEEYHNHETTTTSSTNTSSRGSGSQAPSSYNSSNSHHHHHHHSHNNTRTNLLASRSTAGNRVSLQRHQTNLNPHELIRNRLDPEGQYILYTQLRLARSLEGYPFCGPCMTRQARRQIERLLRECIKDWNIGAYKSVMEMSNREHQELVRRQILFSNPDDFLITAGFGKDWPDGRGLYCDTWEENETPNLMIWCNDQDHFWIISNAKGGNVQEVFTRLSLAVQALESSLQKRNHAFVEDPVLGFLNSSPADIGTALRASVYIKLVRLGQQKGFQDLCKRLRLEARPQYSRFDKRYTGIFNVANLQSLGKSEVELINVMIRGVARCIELEKRLERGDEIDLDSIQE